MERSDKSPFAKEGFRGNVNICGTATILRGKRKALHEWKALHIR